VVKRPASVAIRSKISLINEGVDDGHALLGDFHIRVDLHEDAVNVSRPRLALLLVTLEEIILSVPGNVGKDTTSSNGDIAQQLVELFVVLDGKSNVTRHNTTLLVITSGIASKLKNLSTEILEDSGKVDGSVGTHAACEVLSSTQVTTNTTDREL
jgi:hypothetical protein